VSTRVALVVTLILAVVVNVTRSVWVPDQLDPWLTIALGAAVLGVAAGAAMSADELGLARAQVPSGLRWGLGVVAVIVAGLALVVAVPATRSLLDDDRTQISFGELIWRAAVVIPVATVLVEELLFRGVLLGLLSRVTSAGRALAASAVVFGLWHLLPVWRGGGAGDLGSGGAGGRSGAVAATFLATTFAGIGFGWLRQRSGSLVAPICAHIGTNSATLVAAWIASR
jgi:membrane protease YdiL (CAAX protease family)